MLSLIPALLLLAFHGPAAVERYANEGRLPDALRALERAWTPAEAQAVSEVLSKQRKALASLAALTADPAVLISNNGDSTAIAWARENGIPAVHLSVTRTGSPENLDRAIVDTLKSHRVDLVVLAGYMRKLGPLTLAAYDRRILNVHPALLPKFGGHGMYGKFVHEAVLKSGDAIGDGEVVRTGPGTRAVLRLADGSLVDVNERTEVFIRAAWSGQTVHLQRGDIIVQAVKQRRGRLGRCSLFRVAPRNDD